MRRTFTLTQRTGHAIGFRFVGSVLNAMLSVILSIILARILSPEEFGLFGIAVSIAAIAEVLGSCGMLQALVQLKGLTPEYEAAGATLQFSSAGLISCVLVLGAPLTEGWFGMPGLALVMRLQAAALLINAVALLPRSRLNRRLAFDRLTLIQVSSRALAGVVTIFFALRGLGAAALAIGSFTDAVASTLFLWGCAPGFGSLTFRSRHFHHLFGYGSGILLINVTSTLAHRLDVFIIGRQIGSEAVGLYQRAWQLILLPLHQVTGAVHKVLFSAMSAVQEEKRRFQRGYLGALRLSALAAFPMLTGLWVTADVVVPLVYGPMWEGVVPILQILIISGIFSILMNIHGLVVQTRGQSMAEAIRQGLLLILVAVLGFLGSYAGVFGVAIGVVLAKFIFCISMTRLALSVADIGFVEWMRAMQTGTIGCIVMGLSIAVARHLLSEYLSSGLLFVVIAWSGLFAYLGTVRVCLTYEDSKFVDSMCGILPVHLGNVFRFIFGVNPRRLVQKVDNGVPA